MDFTSLITNRLTLLTQDCVEIQLLNDLTEFQIFYFSRKLNMDPKAKIY